MNKPPLKIILPVFALLLVVGSLLIFKFLDGPTSQSSGSEKKPVNTVDYSGPTDEEIKVGNSQKQQNLDRSQIETATPKSSERSNANIVLVDSTQYEDVFEIRAYVSNIFEDGGTCRATMKKAGATTVEAISKAASSATTTQCGPIDITTNKFDSKGDWQLMISYSSSTSQGSTIQKTVTIL